MPRNILTPDQTLQFLNEKYPNINPKEGENLNIFDNTLRIMGKCFKMGMNQHKTAQVMGVDDNTVKRLKFLIKNQSK